MSTQQPKYASPITEMPNAASENIDIAPAKEIVKIIRRCEKEIFKGWQGSKGIYDDQLLEVMALLKDKAAAIIQEGQKAGIVLSGCGTSGRLAFTITRSFNQILRCLGLPPCLHYLIAGGDEALFVSREAIEDQPLAGQEDLQKLCEHMDSVLFVGISCGLSAPYVAGQLDYCMRHGEKYTPVLLGFNPPYLARNVPIEGWSKTFYEVVMELERLSTEQKGFILTPIIGPEPITGSSRMKCGSATKIILESILTVATLKASGQQEIELEKIIHAYELVQKASYKDKSNIGKMVDRAAKCFQAGGNLHYMGFEGLGVAGIVDASECPPTFGSAREAVRGFVKGGYQTLRNREGELKDFDVSLIMFDRTVVKESPPEDVTVALCKDDGMTASNCIGDHWCLTRHAMAFNFLVHGSMLCQSASNRCAAYVDIAIPWHQVEDLLGSACLAVMQDLLLDMSCKWLCNALSTGAHVRIGKVYRHYMVDLNVSNNKLYHRAIGIVQRLGECSKEDAEQYLLRAIYDEDELPLSVSHAPISQHIQQATTKHKVVPLALLMAITRCTISEAQAELEDSPIIRNAIDSCRESSGRW